MFSGCHTCTLCNRFDHTDMKHNMNGVLAHRIIIQSVLREKDFFFRQLLRTGPQVGIYEYILYVAIGFAYLNYVFRS